MKNLSSLPPHPSFYPVQDCSRTRHPHPTHHLIFFRSATSPQHPKGQGLNVVGSREAIFVLAAFRLTATVDWCSGVELVHCWGSVVSPARREERNIELLIKLILVPTPRGERRNVVNPR